MTSLRPVADSVSVSVLDPDGHAQDVVADYVVGADGARSVVRDSIGAAYVGEHRLRPNTGVVFRRRRPRLPGAAPTSRADLGHQRRDTGMLGPVDRNGLWWLIAFGVDGTSPTSIRAAW